MSRPRRGTQPEEPRRDRWLYRCSPRVRPASEQSWSVVVAQVFCGVIIIINIINIIITSYSVLLTYNLGRHRPRPSPSFAPDKTFSGERAPDKMDTKIDALAN